MDGTLNLVIVAVVSLLTNTSMAIEVESRYTDTDSTNTVGMRWAAFTVVLYELTNIGILVSCSNWFFARLKLVVPVYT